MNLLGLLDTPTQRALLAQRTGGESPARRRHRRSAQSPYRLCLSGVQSAGARRMRWPMLRCRCSTLACQRRSATARPTRAAVGGARRSPRTQARRSFRAASNSAWRLRARSSTGQRCCSPMSQPATSIPTPASRSWRSCSAQCRRADRRASDTRTRHRRLCPAADRLSRWADRARQPRASATSGNRRTRMLERAAWTVTVTPSPREEESV